MKLSRFWFRCLYLLLTFCIGGCHSTKTIDAKPSIAVSPSPPPAPHLGAVVKNPQFSWTDKKGLRVAQVTAESGAATGGGDTETLGQLKEGKAFLYQKGKHVATLTADTLEADSRTRQITGIGNVVFRSENTADGIGNTVRANRMVWNYDQNQITGTGNVLLTREGVVQMPGTRIHADTELQTVDLTGGDTPMTGTY